MHMLRYTKYSELIGLWQLPNVSSAFKSFMKVGLGLCPCLPPPQMKISGYATAHRNKSLADRNPSKTSVISQTRHSLHHPWSSTIAKFVWLPRQLRVPPSQAVAPRSDSEKGNAWDTVGDSLSSTPPKKGGNQTLKRRRSKWSLKRGYQGNKCGNKNRMCEEGTGWLICNDGFCFLRRPIMQLCLRKIYI